jgi:hypothetical protein
VAVPVFTNTWPPLLIPVKEFGLAPGTFTTLNAVCENAKPENRRANTAISATTIATFFVFFTVIPPQEEC